MRYPNDSNRHLIDLDIPTSNNIYEFGVPEVRRQLLLRLFVPENSQLSLPQTELLLCQLPVIKY